MTSPHKPPRRPREPRTPPRSAEQVADVREDRPTSTEPLNRHTLNLAESHAHEADRLAESRAGLTHALLAHFWLNHARTEQA